MTVGSRLRQALDQRGMSVRAFHKAMKKREIAGSSYPQIHRYLNPDGVVPSLEFIGEASILLDVRPEWLALGSGGMTREQEERDAEVRLVSRRFLAGANLDLWREVVDAVPRLAYLSPVGQVAFAEAWRRYCNLMGPTNTDFGWAAFSKEARSHFASSIAEVLEAPFKLFDMHPLVESDEFTDYALAQLQALNLAWKVPMYSTDRLTEVD